MFGNYFFLSLFLICIFSIDAINAQSSELKQNNGMFSLIAVGKNKCDDPDKAMPIFNEMLEYQKTQLPYDFVGFCGVYENGGSGCVILHTSRETFDAIQQWQATDDKWLDYASRAWEYCQIDNFAFTLDKLEKK